MAKKSARKKGSGNIYKDPKSGIYMYRYTVNLDGQSKRITRSLKTKSIREAEQRAKEQYDDLAQVKEQTKFLESYGNATGELKKLEEQRQSKNIIKLSDVKELYLAKDPNKRERPDSAEGTLGNYFRHYNQFVEWLNLNYPKLKYLNDEITEQTACEYADYLDSKNIAAGSFNYKRTALRLIWRILLNDAKLTTNIWDSIPRRDEKVIAGKDYTQAKRGEFTFQEGLAVLSRFDIDIKDSSELELVRNEKGQLVKSDILYLMHKDQMKTVFTIGILTGLRSIDCVHLKWDNLEDTPNGLQIRTKPSKTIRFNKEVVIPVLPELKVELEKAKEWKDETGYIIPLIVERYESNRQCLSKDYSKVLKHCGHNLTREKGDKVRTRGITDHSFYSFRGAFFSYLASRGISLTDLATISGDSTKTLMKYYVKAEESRLAMATHEIHQQEQQQLSGTELLDDRAELKKLIDKVPQSKLEVLRVIIKSYVVK